MKKFMIFAVGLCVVGFVATACGGSSSTSYGSSSSSAPVAMTGGPEAASGSTITISGMNFGEPITVSPGATVSVVNKDTVEHSVTSKTDGQFTKDVDGSEQANFTAPTQPGQYAFYCRYHSNMKGTLIVK